MPSRRSWLFDVVLAAALLMLSLSMFASLTARRDAPYRGVVLTLVVVHCGALAWRRRAPLAVLLVVTVTGLLVVGLGMPSVVLGLALLVAVYTVGAETARARSLPAVAGVLVAMAAALVWKDAADLGTIAGNALVLGVAWFLGDSIRARRIYVERLEERTKELEAARDELTQKALAEERLRIARELHDVVAHSVGMIAVQAGVGRHLIDTDKEQARAALTAIESASKGALQEMRGVLGQLREGEAEITPAPSLRDVHRLADEVRSTGLDVEVGIDEAAHDAGAALQQAAFRIVQEALTNTVRHSGARKASVTVRMSRGQLTVSVIDNGAGAATKEPGGHGIIGMKERARAFGGTLTAGPLVTGGFRVLARLPGGRA